MQEKMENQKMENQKQEMEKVKDYNFLMTLPAAPSKVYDDAMCCFMYDADLQFDGGWQERGEKLKGWRGGMRQLRSAGRGSAMERGTKQIP